VRRRSVASGVFSASLFISWHPQSGAPAFFVHDSQPPLGPPAAGHCWGMLALVAPHPIAPLLGVAVRAQQTSRAALRRFAATRVKVVTPPEVANTGPGF